MKKGNGTEKKGAAGNYVLYRKRFYIEQEMYYYSYFAV